MIVEKEFKNDFHCEVIQNFSYFVEGIILVNKGLSYQTSLGEKVLNVFNDTDVVDSYQKLFNLSFDEEVIYLQNLLERYLKDYEVPLEFLSMIQIDKYNMMNPLQLVYKGLVIMELSLISLNNIYLKEDSFITYVFEKYTINHPFTTIFELFELFKHNYISKLINVFGMEVVSNL